MTDKTPLSVMNVRVFIHDYPTYIETDPDTGIVTGEVPQLDLVVTGTSRVEVRIGLSQAIQRRLADQLFAAVPARLALSSAAPAGAHQ